MNPGFLKWLMPIIFELFKGDKRYRGYFKRNQTIALLVIACIFCLLLALYMFEQAFVHGVNSKEHLQSGQAVEVKLENCRQELSEMKNSCHAIK